ncbi:hypothetical protein [Microlunatus flavus]|uniref:Uncharacterized protein n=1 Tax=Microlunatus flavus TaxID=1036181 RepID=A0A1H9ACI3_9ACTN|nr:hypothetical protein [Microlunatus flavus]SEP74143.1 hypothetical protein SAMN05421756_101551 [Microlunatus flavus]
MPDLLPLAAEGFLDRLQSDWWRLAIVAAVAVTVLVVMVQAVRSKLAVAVATFGAAWVTWQLWNLVSGSRTPLISGEPSLGQLPEVYRGQGWPLVCAVVAIPVSIGIYVATAKTRENEAVPVWMRIVATLSVWFGLLLVLSFVVGATRSF